MANTDDKDKPISAFGLELTLDGNEFVPIVKDGVNYKTTLADVRSGLATEERVEVVEEAQAADLAKITELAGKLNGVQSVSGEFIPKTAIKQSTGDDKNAVVSQKIFTDELNKKANAIAVTEAIDSKADDFTTGYGISMSPTRELSVTIDTGLYKVVNILPKTPTEADKNKIFLVPADTLSDNDRYAEYLWINDAWEKFGDVEPDIELENYYNKAKIDAMFAQVAAKYATKNELDAVELLAESVNQGLGETIERVDDLETNVETLEATKIVGIEIDAEINAEKISAIKVVTGEELIAEAAKYYRFDETVNTLNITLPAISDTTKLQGLIIYFTTGNTPAITINANGKGIRYYNDYLIKANTTYELNIMFNGLHWVVAYGYID